MKSLVTNRPMRAAAVYFKDNQNPVCDCIIWVAGNFLVVAKDENDTAPTWYNVDRIDRLEGVEQMREAPQTRLEQRIAFF